MSLNSCVLRPEGARAEHARVAAAGNSFLPAEERRSLPELPAPADWRSVLRRAFLANGDLEALYFEWRAAYARIDQVATWPNSDIAVSFSYLFSAENMKAWDRTTLGLGFDPSMSVSVPAKTRAAARIALAGAREARERFRAAKFALQRKVLSAYLDLARNEALMRIDEDTLQLLRLVVRSAADRVQAGAPMQDLLKALVEAQDAQIELSGLEARTASVRSELNAMLARPATAALVLSETLPPPRPVTGDDARLIAMAVDENPELAALAQQVAGRSDAVELARLAYVPDLSPSASVMGSVSQSIGSMVMLPSRLPAIRAAIAEARARERASEATLRQTRSDRNAAFVANLYLMRSAETQLRQYRESVLPAAQQLAASARSAYGAGTIGFAEMIDSVRQQLIVRRLLVQVRIDREQRLAELEALAGVDIETLARPAPTAVARPQELQR